MFTKLNIEPKTFVRLLIYLFAVSIYTYFSMTEKIDREDCLKFLLYILGKIEAQVNIKRTRSAQFLYEYK